MKKIRIIYESSKRDNRTYKEVLKGSEQFALANDKQ